MIIDAIVKIFLILLFPFIYLFHPRMRKYHKLRVKYWAADNAFLIDYFGTICISVTVAFFTYWSIAYGAIHVYDVAFKASHHATEYRKEVIREAHQEIRSEPEYRLDLNADETVETHTVEISETEYKEHNEKRKSTAKEDTANSYDEMEKMRQEALARKKCRETGEC